MMMMLCKFLLHNARFIMVNLPSNTLHVDTQPFLASLSEWFISLHVLLLLL